MLAYPNVATAALLLMATSHAKAATTTNTKTNTKGFSSQMRAEFLSAMKSAPIDGKQRRARKQLRNLANEASPDTTPSIESVVEEMKGDSKSSNWLRRKIFEKATFVSPEEVRKRDRDLQNNNNYGYNNGKNYNSNTNANNNNDSTDDYFVASGTWNNAFGFNPAQYSLSYLRCAEVKQFDDELAATEDSTSVFSTKHFAIFRFCPAKTCDLVPVEEDPAAYQSSNNNKNANYNAAMYGQTAANANMVNQEPVWGAAGEGCQSNYGEYMIELEDYLQIMADYRAERFEVYCEYCEACTYLVYTQWIKFTTNQGSDYQYNYSYNNKNKKNRDLYDITQYEEWKRELEEYEEWKHELEEARKLGNNAFDPLSYCPEYNTCKYYADLCNAGIDDTLEDYFECTQVERASNGQVAYIGPHCSQDGVTVTLGVYSDEYCNDYIGNGVDIKNFLGYELEEDALADYVKGSLTSLTIPENLRDYYNPSDQLCIPCRSMAQLYENEDHMSENGGYNVYTDDGTYDDEEINELCENLYQMSARCDHHYRSYSTKTKQSKYFDSNYMQLSCDFIDSVVMGKYDEMGFVILDNSTMPNSNTNNSSLLKSSIYYEEYGHYIEEVSPLQIVGLCASILACSVFALWVAILHGAVKKDKFTWRPRRRVKVLSDDVDISRQDSGIVMGRSQSHMVGNDA